MQRATAGHHHQADEKTELDPIACRQGGQAAERGQADAAAHNDDAPPVELRLQIEV